MLRWPIKNFIKSIIPQIVRKSFATFVILAFVNPAFAQTTQSIARESTADAVACYKSSIKEPYSFYGNPMDTLMLNDGTRWRVYSSGAYEYIPSRYRNVLICPSEGLLVIDKRAISVSRLN